MHTQYVCTISLCTVRLPGWFPYQVVSDAGDGDRMVVPLPLVEEISVQSVLLGQKQSLTIFLLLHLREQ